MRDGSVMVVTVRIIFMLAVVAGFASAETVLFRQSSENRMPLDIEIPDGCVSDGDWADREISIWLTSYNPNHGWTWAIPSRPDGLYLAAGDEKFPLKNPVNPDWGDSGPRQPGSKLELKFGLPERRCSGLRLVCPRGVMVWGGRSGGPITVEFWKGPRCDFISWVDNANRNCFIDCSDLPAEEYVFKFPDGSEHRSRFPVFRRRLPESPQPFEVQVRAITRKDGVFDQTVRIEPHPQPLAAPLPDGKILVGQCVYGHNPEFRDEIITNRLANLLVGWNKATDYTNLPPQMVEAAATNDIHFMTIYGYDSREITDRIRSKLGCRYLCNNIGEFAGYLYQGPKEAAACKVPQGMNLDAARNQFINRFIRNYVMSQHRNYDYIFSTSGSPLGTYELQGGMDFMCCELYAVGAHNLAYATSEMRGAARKWKPEFWGGWLAEEWQTFTVPYQARQKYDLLLAGLFQQYLMGTSVIVLESGAQTTQAHEYTKDAKKLKQFYSDPAPKNYRDTVKRFYDWVAAHPRPAGTPATTAAFVLGNNDAYVGMTHEMFAMWGQHENAASNRNWRCSLPEQTWRTIQQIVYPFHPDVLKPYGNYWLAGSPFGQTDVVNIDSEGRLSDLSRYELLVYAGWNTMTPEIMGLLREYVDQGGDLLICVPHFSTRNDREYSKYSIDDLFGKGNLSKLIDVKVLGRIQPDDGFPVADLELSPGVEVLKRTVSGKPLAVAQRRNRGRVTLLAGWDYPGENNPLAEAYAELVKERLQSHPAGGVCLSGEDLAAVSCAVYGKRVYLLNLDGNQARTVTVNSRAYNETIKLEPLEVRIVDL